MKKFTFRLMVSYTYEIDLTGDQIYPNYAWYLEPEHEDVLKKKKSKKLTAARIRKTVQALGGPGAVLREWNLGPDFEVHSDVGERLISQRVKLSIRPASRKGRRRSQKKIKL